MKLPNSKQFMAGLDRGLNERFLLFLGDEEGEKDKAITRISSMLFANEDDRRNGTSRFYPQGSSNSDFRDAVDFALSPSMFSAARLCVIRNMDQVPVNNENRELVRQLIHEADPSVTVIMTTSDRKVPTLFQKDTRDDIYPVQFWRYFENDLARYIEYTMSEKGLSLDRGVIQELISRTGNDIKKVDEAINLMAGSGLDGNVTVQDVDFLVTDTSEASVFEYVDALFLGDMAALGMLKKLLDDGTAELKILALIVRQADLVESCLLKMGQGMGRDEAAKSCGLHPRAAEKLSGFLGRFNSKSVAALYSMLARAESQLKGDGPFSFQGNPLVSITVNMTSSKATVS